MKNVQISPQTGVGLRQGKPQTLTLSFDTVNCQQNPNANLFVEIADNAVPGIGKATVSYNCGDSGQQWGIIEATPRQLTSTHGCIDNGEI